MYYSDWDDINWKRINYHVRKIQKRIAEATLHKDWHKVRELQQLALHSYDCRLYAVHKVTTRKNIRTPGIDGLFLTTSEDRFAAVDALDYRNYHPQPFKRFYVPKEHNKGQKRPLSVPIIFDRAAEALFLLTIDPVIETCADAHAYGFRKKRSSQDAVRYIVEEFGLLHGRQWILKADVKGCFDHLSHDWIMKHIIFDKSIMQKVLKCGYVYQNRRYSLNEGMPQGGVLSPTITTFVLSGFEKILNTEFSEYNVRICRFVDDYIFSSDNQDVLYNIQVRLSVFLAERGLWLAPEKTYIIHASEGVDFIGWNFRTDGNRLLVRPSDWSKESLMKRLEDIIFSGYKWSARRLIIRINEIVRGWGNYHAYLCPPDYLQKLDDELNDFLWQWAVSRWQNKTVSWIYNHYWKFQHEKEMRRFASGDKELVLFSDIKTKMPIKAEYHKNPYLEHKYFRERRKTEYEYKPILSEHF